MIFSQALLAASDVPPLWTLLPFIVILLVIAVLPLAAPRFWHPNRNKLFVGLAVAAPAAIWVLAVPDLGAHWLAHAGKEYIAFMALLSALYVISGGIRVTGTLAGTPLTNTAILALGAVLANFIGTTGASMLLIRPLIRANQGRVRRAHTVIFFIFIVSNSGGLLTPLGDPPLYLGFMRGVPFLWTLTLFVPWLLVNSILLAVFNIVDQVVFNREERERSGSQLEEVQSGRTPIGIEGGANFLWLAAVVAVIYFAADWGPRVLTHPDLRFFAQTAILLALAAGAYLTTRSSVREANRFTWAPVLEVAAIFAGIFVAMVPALKLVEAEGGKLGLTQPWQYFWATGLLSGVLDNAPTYLTFTALGTSVINAADPGAGVTADNLASFAAHPLGGRLLAAISCGAVFMGAMSYIGNGPNFMVKAIAEESGVRLPGFFGYMAWSVGILVPVFIVLTLLWYR